MSQHTDRPRSVNPSESPDNGPPPDGESREPDGPVDTSFDPAEFELDDTGASSSPSSKPATAEIDPFDPETYKRAQDLAAAAGVREVLTDLPHVPPNAAWWVRRHPDPKYSFTARVIELKDRNETYLVLPHLWPSLMDEPTLKRKTFYLATTMQGKLFLWSVRVPADDTQEPDRWMKAPLEAVRLAKDRWTRIAWNQEKREHDVKTCASTVEPRWPDLPFRKLLELSFKGYVIDNMDHPVLRQLRGEVS
jgi:hypothetical protein